MSSVTDASNWVRPLKGQMAPARRSWAVLVVDDEPGMRNFLCKALEQECALVETADSVEKAEELRRRYHFDLLIVDILREMDWNAEETGTQSIVPYYLSLMDAERAASVQRKMTKVVDFEEL